MVTRNKKGFYPIIHEGVEYLLISVTTVLKRILNKPALYFWYGKHGNSKCKEILLESSILGTRVHDYINWDLSGRKGEEVTIPSDTQQAVNNYHAFKKKFKLKPVLIEKTVYSLVHGYAGQLDCVGWVTDKQEEKLILLDWKTSSGIYEDHELQLQAYYQAIKEIKGIIFKDKISMLPTELWCVRLDKEGPIEYNKDIGKYKPCDVAFKAFCGLLDNITWQNKRKEK